MLIIKKMSFWKKIILGFLVFVSVGSVSLILIYKDNIFQTSHSKSQIPEQQNVFHVNDSSLAFFQVNLENIRDYVPSIPMRYALDKIIPIGSLDNFNNVGDANKLVSTENNFRSIRVLCHTENNIKNYLRIDGFRKIKDNEIILAASKLINLRMSNLAKKISAFELNKDNINKYILGIPKKMADIYFNVLSIEPIENENDTSAKITLEATTTDQKESLCYVVDGFKSEYDASKEIVENFITNNVFGFNLKPKARINPMEAITIKNLNEYIDGLPHSNEDVMVSYKNIELHADERKIVLFIEYSRHNYSRIISYDIQGFESQNHLDLKIIDNFIEGNLKKNIKATSLANRIPAENINLNNYKNYIEIPEFPVGRVNVLEIKNKAVSEMSSSLILSMRISLRTVYKVVEVSCDGFYTSIGQKNSLIDEISSKQNFKIKPENPFLTILDINLDNFDSFIDGFNPIIENINISKVRINKFPNINDKLSITINYQIGDVSKNIDHQITGFYSEVLDKEDIYKELEEQKELFFVNEGAKYMNQKDINVNNILNYIDGFRPKNKTIEYKVRDLKIRNSEEIEFYVDYSKNGIKFEKYFIKDGFLSFDYKAVDFAIQYYEKYQGGIKIIPHIVKNKLSRDVANENININFTNLPNQSILTNGVTYTSKIYYIEDDFNLGNKDLKVEIQFQKNGCSRIYRKTFKDCAKNPNDFPTINNKNFGEIKSMNDVVPYNDATYAVDSITSGTESGYTSIAKTLASKIANLINPDVDVKILSGTNLTWWYDSNTMKRRIVFRDWVEPKSGNKYNSFITITYWRKGYYSTPIENNINIKGEFLTKTLL